MTNQDTARGGLYLGTQPRVDPSGKVYTVELHRPDGKSISPKEYADLVELLGYDRPTWVHIEDYFKHVPAWMDQERHPRHREL